MPYYASQSKLSYLKSRELLKDQLEKKYQLQFGPRYKVIVIEEVDKFLNSQTIKEGNYDLLEQAIRDRISGKLSSTRSRTYLDPINRSQTANIDSRSTNNQSKLNQSALSQQNKDSNNNLSGPKNQNDFGQQTNQNGGDQQTNITFSGTGLDQDGKCTFSQQSSQLVKSASAKPRNSIFPPDIYNPFTDYQKPHFSITKKPRNDEWAKIQNYKYLQDQKEEEIRQQEELKRKMQLNALFQAQLKEKKELELEKQREYERWKEQERLSHLEWLEDEARKKEEQHQMFLREKEDRLNQVRETKERKENELMKEKTMANRIATHLQKQLEEENAYDKQRTIDEKNRIKAILEGNELTDIRKREISMKEREEDIRLMKEKVELDIRAEKQKEDELKRRLEKIDQRAKFVLGSTQVQETLAKQRYEEERLKRQVEDQKLREEEAERNEKDEKFRRSRYYQDLLREQIIEKQVRRKMERDSELDFSKDFINKNNIELSKEKDEYYRIKDRNLKHSHQLAMQMGEERDSVDNITKRELEINRQLLNNINQGKVVVNKGWRP